MTHRLLRSFVLVCSLCCQAHRVRAEESTSASKHFRAGLDHALTGELERAVEEFQAAYADSPHYSVLFNIGQTYTLMGKPVEAIDAFERYLRGGGKAIAPSRRKAVEASIAFHAKRVGELQVLVEPADATLEVDGQAVTSDWQRVPLRLAAGKHGLVVSAAGFRAQTLAVTVQAGQRSSLSLTLRAEAPLPHGVAQLKVACDVPAVEILVDGRRRGRTPVSEPFLVDAGSHRVRFSRDGYEADERLLEVGDGQLATLACGLRYAPVAAGGAAATLSLRLSPGTRLRLDGAPFSGGSLPAGEHRVEAEKAGFRPWRRDLSLSAGSRTVLDVSLQPEPAYLEQYRANVRRRRTWGLAVGTGGALFGAAAVVLWIANRNQYDEWQNQKRSLEATPVGEPDFQDKLRAWQDQARAVERLNGLTAGCALASGALLTVGAALWLSAGDPERYGRLTARVAHSGPEFAWRTAW